MIKIIKRERGFTIIELVIVLAIASLILLAVFLAIGGAQRTQRDQARKAIAGRVSNALENYASNHNGSYNNFAAEATQYFTGITDPDTNGVPTAGGVTTAGGGVHYQLGAVCPGSTDTPTPRRYAVHYWSENANGSQCTGN